MIGFLKGSATAMITPFTDGGVNLDEYGRTIEYQIENGTDALIVLGTTGEPATMTEEEKESVIRYAVEKCANRCKVIVGTGSNCTEKAVAASKRAQALGADGVLCVTPYYNKCTQNGLIEYYRAIASAVSVPVICYNVPSRTGVNLLPSTMAKIAEIDNIAGIKDACGNMASTLETMRLVRGKCDVYSGEDALNLPILACGGTAVISVVSNLLPRAVKTLTQYALEGKLNEARDLNDRLLPVATACFSEVNPIPVKAGMNMLGFTVGIPRAPLTECEPQNAQKLKEALTAFGAEVKA